MKKSSLITIVGLSIVFSGSAAAMNLLTNPSFEDGVGAVTFSSSTEFGGADAFELTSPSSEIAGWVWSQTPGTSGGAAWLHDTAGDFIGADQDHLLFLDANQCIGFEGLASAAAGDDFQLDYNFASWTRSQDNSPASGSDSTIILEYTYLDALGVEQDGMYTGPGEIVAPDNFSNGPNDLVWITGSHTFEIPADYDSNFLFNISNTGGVLVDGLSITAVPEPGSVMFVGLSLIAFTARRRRS